MTNTSTRTADRRPATGRPIGPIGTLARVAVGALALGKPLLAGADGGLQWHEAALGLLLVPAALLFVQLVRARLNPAPFNAAGPVGVVLITTVGLVLANIDFTSDATFLFLGGSMLLAAVRGYAGCEVMAVGNWLLRRNDKVGCILFSPIDAIEGSVKRAGGHSRAA